MSEGKLQGTVMAGAANAPAGAAPSPANSVIEKLAAQQGEMEAFSTGDHTINLKAPSGSNYLRAIEMAEGATNLVPFFEAMMCIIGIDGDLKAPARNKQQIYDLADVIGRQAIDQLLLWYQNKAMPEVSEVIRERPDLPVGSPEFQELVNQKRAAKTKK